VVQSFDRLDECLRTWREDGEKADATTLMPIRHQRVTGSSRSRRL